MDGLQLDWWKMGENVRKDALGLCIVQNVQYSLNSVEGTPSKGYTREERLWLCCDM